MISFHAAMFLLQFYTLLRFLTKINSHEFKSTNFITSNLSYNLF